MDANFVMRLAAEAIEFQTTSEGKFLSKTEFMKLKALADQGVATLARLQLKAVPKQTYKTLAFRFTFNFF